MKRKNKELIKETLKLLYPIILLFGIYLIVYGHDGPGGGFQGGVVLASSYIIKYIANDSTRLDLEKINYMEKMLYFLLVLFSFLVIVYSLDFVLVSDRKYFFVFFNILIGIKVCLATLIIFFRFVIYEDVR